MTKEKVYTIGEIFRGKMLINFSGRAYGDKSQVAKAVKRLAYRIIETPHGPAKVVPMSEIKRHNARRKDSAVPPARKVRS